MLILEYTKGAYGIFYAVVINFYSSVVYVSGKPWKKRVRIFNSFTHAAFRKHSLIASCKSAEVDPRIWLEDVLSKIPYNERDKKDMTELLPRNWAKSNQTCSE